jgi:hypothetical protein
VSRSRRARGHVRDDAFVAPGSCAANSRANAASRFEGRGPGPAARLAVEGLAFARGHVHDRLQPVLADECEVLGEALLALDAVFRAAYGPPQDHALHDVRIPGRERDRDGAPHAAAKQLRGGVSQVVEEALALLDIMQPRHGLDAPARLAAFTAVVEDAGVFRRQVIEQLDARVHAERAPLLRSSHRIRPAPDMRSGGPLPTTS